MKKNIKILFFSIGFILLLNVLGHYFFHRFDLTKDKRYTLSDTSLSILKKIKEPLFITVYLEGEFPAEFKKLQTETRQIVEEFQAYNSNIIVNFENPVEEDANMTKVRSLFKKGLI